MVIRRGLALESIRCRDKKKVNRTQTAVYSNSVLKLFEKNNIFAKTVYEDA